MNAQAKVRKSVSDGIYENRPRQDVILLEYSFPLTGSFSFLIDFGYYHD